MYQSEYHRLKSWKKQLFDQNFAETLRTYLDTLGSTVEQTNRILKWFVANHNPL